MSFPKISIVTPIFNSAPTLRETIESVLAQDYKNWEHIVMDGGSNDGTLDILRSYPHLQWVSEKDKGHYHAMNKGIERASGEVVAILNGDDCYREGALSNVAEAFDKHPDWDGLFGDVVYVDGQGEEIFRRHEAAYDYDILRFGNVCYIIHPTLFVKKKIYDRLGAYQTREISELLRCRFYPATWARRAHVSVICRRQSLITDCTSTASPPIAASPKICSANTWPSERNMVSRAG